MLVLRWHVLTVLFMFSHFVIEGFTCCLIYSFSWSRSLFRRCHFWNRVSFRIFLWVFDIPLMTPDIDEHLFDCAVAWLKMYISSQELPGNKLPAQRQWRTRVSSLVSLVSWVNLNVVKAPRTSKPSPLLAVGTGQTSHGREGDGRRVWLRWILLRGGG